MRLARVILATSLALGALFTTFAGCRDATQVTLDISLRNAMCSEIHGTAVTVGVDAEETEARVAAEYVTGSTTSCDVAPSASSAIPTHAIGTLVVTPSDSGHASVIVVVAYDKVAPSSCTPPLYKGCIVARRQFAFTSHTQVVLPITIDPICKDVPCDAFSTCRTGKCFKADTDCTSGTCVEPGDPGDGGTSEAGQVVPDTGVPDDGASPDGNIDGASDASHDGASDASDSGDADDSGDGSSPTGGNAYCDPVTDTLNCNAQGCVGLGPACCGTSPSATFCRAPNMCLAGETRYCCAPTDCPSNVCLRVLMPAGMAVMMPIPIGSKAVGTCSP